MSTTDWTKRRLEFTVICPAEKRGRVDALLNEQGIAVAITERGHLRCEVVVGEVVSRMGDYGPEEWTWHAVDLAVDRSGITAGGEGDRLLSALALQEWCTSLCGDLADFDAELWDVPKETADAV